MRPWPASALSACAVSAALVVTGCGGSSSTSSSPASTPSSPTASAAPAKVGTGAAGAHPGQRARRRGGRSEPAPRGRAPRTRSEPLPTASIEVSIPTERRGEESYILKRYTCDGANTSPPVRWSGVPRGTAELALFVIALQPVKGHLFFDWAVDGLKAATHGVAAGTLPPGAVVGRNGFGHAGYSICPAKGAPAESYAVRLIALHRPLTVEPGFDAEALYREAERSAKVVVGIGGGVYKRA